LLQFVEGGDLVAQQKRAKCIGAVGGGSHNVIVPAIPIPTDRYYNKPGRGWPRLTEDHGTAVFEGWESASHFEDQTVGKTGYDR
jgi:hypothetical protein